MTPLSCWLLDDGDSHLCRHRDGHLCHSSEARRPFLGSNHRLHLSHRWWPLHDGEFDPTYFYIWNCLLIGFGVVAGFCTCVCVFLFLFCTDCCYSSHHDSAIEGLTWLLPCSHLVPCVRQAERMWGVPCCSRTCARLSAKAPFQCVYGMMCF